MYRNWVEVIKYISVLAAITTSIQSSNASTFFDQNFVCPIGGEKFTESVVGSNSTWGERPDGKPYGSLSIYPLIECPENGFIMFKEEWTEQELSILKDAISTAEFENMRQSETSYYRLWWLRSKIAKDPIALADALLNASWESDNHIERKHRYQTMFIAAAKNIVQMDDPEYWFWLNLRAANAMRELGQFTQSLEYFKLVESNIPLNLEEDTQSYLNKYFVSQRQLIAEENKASEPANMIGENNASWRCIVHKSELTASEMPICNSDSVKQRIASIEITTEDGIELKGEEAIIYIAKKYRKF